MLDKLCNSLAMPVPVPEYRFHGTRKWRFDWAWPDQMLALEIEGGIWLSKFGKKSRHFTGAGATADMVKYNTAAAMGWRIIRVTPKELLTEKTIQLIQKSLHL